MNKREEKILRHVVKEYIKAAKPISSKILSKKYIKDLSPASIRITMVELCNKGYLIQPHTSAGRVPTEKAYQFFVDKFCEPKLPYGIEKRLESIFSGRRKGGDVLKEAGRFIAFASHGVSLFSQKEDFFWEGLSHFLSQPEFYDASNVLEAIEDFEELYRAAREEMVSEIKGTQIFFPSGVVLEWNHDSDRFLFKSDYSEREKFLLKDEDLSLILSNLEDGFIGILGPTRMDYSRNIALIEKTKELLGEK